MRISLTRKTAYFYCLTMLISSGLLFNHLLHLRAAHAQSPTGNGVCHDPWLNDLIPARKKFLCLVDYDKFGTSVDGIGVQGECNPKLYNNGSWSTQAALSSYIDYYLKHRVVGVCRDSVLTSAITAVWGRAPRGYGESQDCNIYMYGGGNWDTYQHLKDYITANKNSFATANIDWSVAGLVRPSSPGTVIQPLPAAVAGQGTSVYLIDGNNIRDARGNIILNGGGNIVAQGGGNIVAQGGGNIVAQGGGNILGGGDGNIVAQGGGNYRTLSLGTKAAKLVKAGNISIIIPAGK